MRKSFLFVSLALLVLGSAISAQPSKVSESAIEGARGELIAHIQEAEDKFVALAKSTPLKKYTWRPGEGVRSIGEVFWHMIQANYGLPSVVGVKPPEDRPKDPKTFKKKEDIADALKKSFEYTRKVVENFSDSDLEKSVKFRGSNTTYRGVLNFMNNHTNQHLGQIVAYARTNGIIPPWSVKN